MNSYYQKYLKYKKKYLDLKGGYGGQKLPSLSNIPKVTEEERKKLIEQIKITNENIKNKETTDKQLKAIIEEVKKTSTQPNTIPKEPNITPEQPNNQQDLTDYEKIKSIIDNFINTNKDTGYIDFYKNNEIYTYDDYNNFMEILNENQYFNNNFIQLQPNFWLYVNKKLTNQQYNNLINNINEHSIFDVFTRIHFRLKLYYYVKTNKIIIN